MTEFWDDPTKDYRQRYALPDQFIWDLASQPRIDFDGYMTVVKSLLPEPPAQVLDVGCGPGLGAKIIHDYGHQVTGIDYNQRAIGFAKLLVPEAKFICADVRSLGKITELQNKFGIATFIEVIEHIPPQYHEEVLTGIRETLTSSGILILATPSSHMPLNRWDYKRFGIEELTAVLRACGFDVKRIIYQHRLSLFMSRTLWRLVNNKYYDLRLLRNMIRRIFLRYYNTTSISHKAGRFIISAEAVK